MERGRIDLGGIPPFRNLFILINICPLFGLYRRVYSAHLHLVHGSRFKTVGRSVRGLLFIMQFAADFNPVTLEIVKIQARRCSGNFHAKLELYLSGVIETIQPS